MAALGGPAWLRARRAAAFDRYEAASLPTEAEEVWRYSRIEDLDLDAYRPVDGVGAGAESGPPADVQPVLDAVGARAALLVLRNGRPVHVEVDPGLAERGLSVGSLAGAAAGDDLLGSAATRSDAFTELSTAFLADGAVVDVPRHLVVEPPVVVVNWVDADADGTGVFPRTIVRAGENSQVTVLDYLASADVDVLAGPVVELDAHSASLLRYCNVQELGPRAWQVGYQVSRVGRSATLESSTVALGGDYARVRADAKLVGEGGVSHLLAVYFGDRGQMHDFRTMQDHDAPRTTSDLLFKGAVTDDAHSVYSGLIRIARGAVGTKAFQTNRNLVLADGARADSVPNLEIDENDVRCSHASAVGPIDAEQRYYLEARGIPTEVADRLIVLGFFDEVVTRTPVAGLHPLLRWAVAAKLAGTATAAATGVAS